MNSISIYIYVFIMIAAAVALFTACEVEPTEPELINAEREEAIPDDAVKMGPESDLYIPVLNSDAWESPIPMPGPVNTAGAEDSPFISPDGSRFFFFFTPDVDIPAEKQILDGVTGIWWCRRSGDTWTVPTRIILNDDLSLDGAPFVLEDTLWFASVRESNYGEIDVYTAIYSNGSWGDWQNAGAQLNVVYDIGEFHLSGDGSMIYFGWDWEDGYGGRDIWVSAKHGLEWLDPVNLGENVNSDHNEDQPFVTPAGNELWFTGESVLGYPGPAVFRSIKSGDVWGEPQEIISNYAGEPTLDDDGNIYFVHHFFDKDLNMIEADIYVAYQK